MFLRSTAVALLLAVAASAQTNVFDVQSGMKSVGHASYTLSPAKQGYKLSSRSDYHVNGIESELSDDFKYSSDYAYLDGGSSSVTSQTHFSYTPNKARTDLVVGMVQAGAQDSRHLAIKPNFVVLPSNDPGAAQAMLLLATTHPTPDNLYNVVVPGGGAGGGGRAMKGAAPDPGQPSAARPALGNNAYDARWTKGPDTDATFDGKPVTVHTYFLTSGKVTWTFFADDTNTLMQIDNSMAKASCVRARFQLPLPH